MPIRHIVQLSDLHLVPPPGRLYGEIDTDAAFADALGRVATLTPRPDCVVISGDLVDSGTPADYAWLAHRLRALPVPCALLPGNHDDPSALRAAFPGQGYCAGARCCRTVEWPDGRLLLADSTVPGAEGGALSGALTEWLDAVQADRKPALLFLHHPPFLTGIAGMDAIACTGAERFAVWLGAHPEVAGIYCGHVHRAICTSVAGRPAMTAPGTAHQIECALDGAPGDLAYVREPGGMLLHRWQPGLPPVSHVLPVARASGRRYADLPAG